MTGPLAELAAILVMKKGLEETAKGLDDDEGEE
jgi:hypothetical protein